MDCPKHNFKKWVKLDEKLNLFYYHYSPPTKITRNDKTLVLTHVLLFCLPIFGAKSPASCDIKQHVIHC